MVIINKDDFIKKLSILKNATSKTGTASYSSFLLKGSKLYFKRDNKNTYWEIDINQLYEAYCNLNFINTVNIQKYINGRVYSPACAILIAMGLYDEDGNKK